MNLLHRLFDWLSPPKPCQHDKARTVTWRLRDGTLWAKTICDCGWRDEGPVQE